MRCDLLLDARQLTLKRSNQQRERRPHLRVARVCEAIGLLDASGNQIVAMAHQRAQFALGCAGWHPHGQFVGGAESRDGGTILLVGLVAQHLTLGVALDAGRVDHMHGDAALDQILGQSFPIDIGGLHTGTQRGCLVFGQEPPQGAEAARCVGKGAMMPTTCWRAQGDIKGLFGQVNAENVHGFPPSNAGDVFLAQPCPYLLAEPQSDSTRPDGTRERGVPANRSVRRRQAQ